MYLSKTTLKPSSERTRQSDRTTSSNKSNHGSTVTEKSPAQPVANDWRMYIFDVLAKKHDHQPGQIRCGTIWIFYWASKHLASTGRIIVFLKGHALHYYWTPCEKSTVVPGKLVFLRYMPHYAHSKVYMSLLNNIVCVHRKKHRASSENQRCFRT